jgi:hypothetical protein
MDEEEIEEVFKDEVTKWTSLRGRREQQER